MNELLDLLASNPQALGAAGFAGALLPFLVKFAVKLLKRLAKKSANKLDDEAIKAAEEALKE